MIRSQKMLSYCFHIGTISWNEAECVDRECAVTGRRKVRHNFMPLHLLASTEQHFLSINDAYADWHEAKFNKKINRRMVLSVNYALQGHPESGKQLMNMINNVLKKETGFQTTTHDRCIYRHITSDGKIQLMFRQVDDFLLACDTEKTAKVIFKDIGTAIQFDTKKES